MGSIAIPSGSGGGGSGLSVLKDLTGVLLFSTQNKTITFSCNTDDLIIVPHAVPNSVTNAILLADGSSGTYGMTLMAYKAISTSVTIKGTGNTSNVLVFLNSKKMSNHVSNIDRSQLTNRDANLIAKKGDLVFLLYANALSVPKATDPNSINFRCLLPLGAYVNYSVYMVTENNNARYYTPGNNLGLTILHFDY